MLYLKGGGGGTFSGFREIVKESIDLQNLNSSGGNRSP